MTRHDRGGADGPRSLLNALRRDLVARLDEEASHTAPRSLAAEPVLPALCAARDFLQAGSRVADGRTLAIRSSAGTPGKSRRRSRPGSRRSTSITRTSSVTRRPWPSRVASPASLFLATPRIQKPVEANLFRYLGKQGADGLLVRNAGGLYFCAERGIPFVADFSLNASNELTVELLEGARGASGDGLLRPQLRATRRPDRGRPRPWLEIVIHQQIPMFHMEHCVFCAFLSPGTDKTNCGRPCDDHDVKLRDRVGKEHPLKADVGCRNTLFNAVPQTAAEYLPRLLAHGARHLRIEFLDDGPGGGRANDLALLPTRLPAGAMPDHSGVT